MTDDMHSDPGAVEPAEATEPAEPTDPAEAAADPAADVQRIIDSAARLGIEIDEAETLQWLAAISASSDGSDLVVDDATGTFGHRVSMLDFSDRDLARFRRIGHIVEVTGPAGVAESALALSGSAAQSKIQSFPGDCDYFQRLNIIAETRAEACNIMAELMREKVLNTHRGDGYQFLEAKLGTYPIDGIHAGSEVRAGSPISWTFDEIASGELHVTSDDGTLTLRWHEVALDPGWCKLDWVVSDPNRRQLSNASNVIDVTWEGPDGEIVPLDGYLDAYFQEVYLDADAVPVFAKLANFVSDDALDSYVEQLQSEVRKYLTKNLNYGKAAKRMYNVFRLSGRYMDAAFVRELFDEPATILYQVWSLISTLDNATQPDSSIPMETVQSQTDELIIAVVNALDGDEETELVKALLGLRQTLGTLELNDVRSSQVEAARNQVVNLINTFFRDKLESMPSIREYIEVMQREDAASA